MKFESYSSEDTEKIAYELGQALKPGDVICLGGDLGAGKTVFAKGLAKGLGVVTHVTSPTFTIINEYTGRHKVYHFDVYRIEDPEEMYEIGFEEYVYGDGICIIEWADNIKEILPAYYKQVIITKDIEKSEYFREIHIKEVK